LGFSLVQTTISFLAGRIAFAVRREAVMGLALRRVREFPGAASMRRMRPSERIRNRSTA